MSEEHPAETILSLSAAALAASTGSNPDALHRVLRALANHGVFTLNDGRFSHSPASMRSLARMMGLDFHWDVFRELGYSLNTGESAADRAVPRGLFEHLRKHLQALGCC